jgi:hypothetical protein
MKTKSSNQPKRKSAKSYAITKVNYSEKLVIDSAFGLTLYPSGKENIADFRT